MARLYLMYFQSSLQFYNKNHEKCFLSGTGIRTYKLIHMSLLLYTLDQACCRIVLNFHSMKGKKTFPHLFLSSAEAWLWEETYAIKVVRLNPCCTTFYWMSVFTLFWCKIVMSFVWKRSKNRTEMDHRKNIFIF